MFLNTKCGFIIHFQNTQKDPKHNLKQELLIQEIGLKKKKPKSRPLRILTPFHEKLISGIRAKKTLYG